MKKGFLAGFALSLAVVLLPTFYYMDARSSSGGQSRTDVSADPPDLLQGNPKEAPLHSDAAHSPDSPLAPLSPPPLPETPAPGVEPESSTPGTQKEEPANEIVMLKNPMPVQAVSPPVPVRPKGGIRTRVYDPDRIYTLRPAVLGSGWSADIR